ncbi:hypothetical protein AYI69_g11400 [Smittium culicis]|uniref:Uncharacterized protein n=1 Tax=Smittium culicis TaxID=133412 RepID=A0A1R1WZ20_9FUNG|nr:hypothetical protein AYI69_g11400 [Smittium culicis]
MFNCDYVAIDDRDICVNLPAKDFEFRYCESFYNYQEIKSSSADEKLKGKPHSSKAGVKKKKRIDDILPKNNVAKEEIRDSSGDRSSTLVKRMENVFKFKSILDDENGSKKPKSALCNSFFDKDTEILYGSNKDSSSGSFDINRKSNTEFCPEKYYNKTKKLDAKNKFKLFLEKNGHYKFNLDKTKNEKEAVEKCGIFQDEIQLKLLSETHKIHFAKNQGSLTNEINAIAGNTSEKRKNYISKNESVTGKNSEDKTRSNFETRHRISECLEYMIYGHIAHIFYHTIKVHLYQTELVRVSNYKLHSGRIKKAKIKCMSSVLKKEKFYNWCNANVPTNYWHHSITPFKIHSYVILLNTEFCLTKRANLIEFGYCNYINVKYGDNAPSKEKVRQYHLDINNEESSSITDDNLENMDRYEINIMNSTAGNNSKDFDTVCSDVDISRDSKNQHYGRNDQLGTEKNTQFRIVIDGLLPGIKNMYFHNSNNICFLYDMLNRLLKLKNRQMQFYNCSNKFEYVKCPKPCLHTCSGACNHEECINLENEKAGFMFKENASKNIISDKKNSGEKECLQKLHSKCCADLQKLHAKMKEFSISENDVYPWIVPKYLGFFKFDCCLLSNCSIINVDEYVE